MRKLTLCHFETPRIGSFAGILKSSRDFLPEKHENQNEQEQRQSNGMEKPVRLHEPLRGESLLPSYTSLPSIRCDRGHQRLQA